MAAADLDPALPVVFVDVLVFDAGFDGEEPSPADATADPLQSPEGRHSGLDRR